MSTDKEERKLKKVKISLMRNPMFAMWSGLMMVGKTRIDDDCPTAATNGRDEIYGREFVKDLTEKELAFVVLHECMHKIYRHYIAAYILRFSLIHDDALNPYCSLSSARHCVSGLWCSLILRRELNMVGLLNKAFIDELTDEEEATLNRLEQEWLLMCAMAESTEWQNPTPIIKATSLN